MPSILTSPLGARVHGKFKRAMLRAPLLRQWSEHAYYAALGRHAEKLRLPAYYAVAAVEALRRDWMVELDGGPMLPRDVQRDALALCERLSTDASPRSSVESSAAEVAEMPSVYRWGLEDHNLDLAECYIGLPVRYLGVSVKREKADAGQGDVRQWHVDVEDRRMLKLIVYLDEVGDGEGPLEYLDRAATQEAMSKLGYWTGFVSDARMDTAIERSRWRRVVGPAFTVAVIDTCRLFHRAKPPVSRDRYSLSFSYCSVRPHQLFPEYFPDRAMVSSLAAQLTPRQRAATVYA
jgi:hypothetical protein